MGHTAAETGGHGKTGLIARPIKKRPQITRRISMTSSLRYDLARTELPLDHGDGLVVDLISVGSLVMHFPFDRFNEGY